MKIAQSFTNSFFLFVTFLFITQLTIGQVAINNDGSSPDASSILDLKASDGGILIPRMTAIQRDAIISPATGLLVYITDDSAFHYFNGNVWTVLSSSPDGDWTISGNDMYSAVSGNVGVGLSTPYTKLHITSNTTNLLTVQNTTGGLGITSGILFSTFSGNGANARIASVDEWDYNGALAFYTDNDDTENANPQERMRISKDGNIGIGTDDPDAFVHFTKNEYAYCLAETTGDYDAGYALKATSVGSESNNVNGFAVFIKGADNSGDFCINEDYINGVWSPTNRITLENETGNFGIGVSDPQQKLHVSDVLRLEPQSSPPSGDMGDLYVGTDGKLYFHNGASWKEVSLVP